jgi:hypothetical protein
MNYFINKITIIGIMKRKISFEKTILITLSVILGLTLLTWVL